VDCVRIRGVIPGNARCIYPNPLDGEPAVPFVPKYRQLYRTSLGPLNFSVTSVISSSSTLSPSLATKIPPGSIPASLAGETFRGAEPAIQAPSVLELKPDTYGPGGKHLSFSSVFSGIRKYVCRSSPKESSIPLTV
jgi:hypothetical protein